MARGPSGPGTEWKVRGYDKKRLAWSGSPAVAAAPRSAREAVAVVTGRVVVGVDGSPGSRRALAWAVEEAMVRRVAIEAVYIWQSPYDLSRDFDVSYPVDEAELAESASVRLADAISGLGGAHTTVEIESVVLEGDPAERLCERADAADMLVIGSHGRGTLAGLLLGSVSARCAHRCRRPVVIVPSPRQQHEISEQHPTDKILVGVDASPGSLRALRWAAEEAGARGAVVEALTVRRKVEAGVEVRSGPAVPPPASDGASAAEPARQRLEDVVAESLGQSSVDVHSLVLEGDPAETLWRRAAEADMLVVGARGSDRFAERLLGSVSDKCAQHSPVPIVIVPADRHDRAPGTAPR